MKKYLLPCTWIFAIVYCASATTVIPPTFDELVGHAGVIFQGHVTDVKSEEEPVKNVAHLGKMGSRPLPEEPDLSVADFKAAVKNKLQRQQ